LEADRELLRTPSGFGRLFERHGRAVYNYCFRRTADWSAAEDLPRSSFSRPGAGARTSGSTATAFFHGSKASPRTSCETATAL
jgi:DNA-directed RNA polymerase specialized sigma24 family protein